LVKNRSTQVEEVPVKQRLRKSPFYVLSKKSGRIHPRLGNLRNGFQTFKTGE